MEPEKPKPGLSPAPGLRRGDAVCSVTWERPHPSTLPPLPRAAVGGSTKGQKANCKQSGEGITRPGVWPHASEAMNFPAPAWKGREGVGEEKAPSNGDNSQHLRAPLPKPGASPYTYLCFPLISRWDARQSCPRDTCVRSLPSPFPPSHFPASCLRTGNGRWALQRGQVRGWYGLFSSEMQCICLSAHLPPSPSLLVIGSRLEAGDKAGLQCPVPISG